MKKIAALSGVTLLSSLWPVIQRMVHAAVLSASMIGPGVLILFRFLSPLVCGLIIGGNICAVFHEPGERGAALICFIFMMLNAIFAVVNICVSGNRFPVYNVLTTILLFLGFIFSMHYHQHCESGCQPEE